MALGLNEVSKWELVEFVMKPELSDKKSIIDEFEPYYFVATLRKKYSFVRWVEDKLIDYYHKNGFNDEYMIHSTKEIEFDNLGITPENIKIIESCNKILYVTSKQDAMKIKLANDDLEIIDIQEHYKLFLTSTGKI